MEGDLHGDSSMASATAGALSTAARSAGVGSGAAAGKQQGFQPGQAGTWGRENALKMTVLPVASTFKGFHGKPSPSSQPLAKDRDLLKPGPSDPLTSAALGCPWPAPNW